MKMQSLSSTYSVRALSTEDVEAIYELSAEIPFFISTVLSL